MTRNPDLNKVNLPIRPMGYCPRSTSIGFYTDTTVKNYSVITILTLPVSPLPHGGIYISFTLSATIYSHCLPLLFQGPKQLQERGSQSWREDRLLVEVLITGKRLFAPDASMAELDPKQPDCQSGINFLFGN